MLKYLYTPQKDQACKHHVLWRRQYSVNTSDIVVRATLIGCVSCHSHWHEASLRGVTARCHCEVSLRGVTVRCHCEASLYTTRGVTARCHWVPQEVSLRCQEVSLCATRVVTSMCHHIPWEVSRWGVTLRCHFGLSLCNTRFVITQCHHATPVVTARCHYATRLATIRVSTRHVLSLRGVTICHTKCHCHLSLTDSRRIISLRCTLSLACLFTFSYSHIHMHIHVHTYTHTYIY